MLLAYPGPRYGGGGRLFRPLEFIDRDSNSNYGSRDRPPGTPNGDAGGDGHDGHQSSDRLWRQSPPGDPYDDEPDRGPEPDEHHAIGDMSGARCSQERHRRQIQRRTPAEDQPLAVPKRVPTGGSFN